MNAFARQELASIYTGLSLLDKDAAEPAHVEPAANIQKQARLIVAKHVELQYEPLIEVRSGAVSGYQASVNIMTKSGNLRNMAKLANCWHDSTILRMHTELELKRLQIAYAPSCELLVLDLDIESLFACGESSDNPMLQLFRQHAWGERELVINLLQHGNVADACRSQRAIEWLQTSGMAIALEETGLHWGMFNLSAFMDACMIKLNGDALCLLGDKAAYTLVDWLMSAARRLGVSVLMSGVDSCERYEWAKRLGVDHVQGSLFAKQAIHLRDCQG